MQSSKEIVAVASPAVAGKHGTEMTAPALTGDNTPARRAATTAVMSA
jgi:hypothetical protein